MIVEQIKEIKGANSQLRRFGIKAAVGLCLLAGLLFFRRKDYYFYLFIPAAAFVVLSLAAPRLLKPVQKTALTLGIILGWLATRLILLVSFYLVITPLGVIAKVLGKRFLDTKCDRLSKSYWIVREPVAFDKGNCENQF